MHKETPLHEGSLLHEGISLHEYIFERWKVFIVLNFFY